jgi:hypothetical protein
MRCKSCGHEHSVLRGLEPYPGYHQRLETDIPTIIRRIEPPILETGQSVPRVRIHPAPPTSHRFEAFSRDEGKKARV